MQVVRFKGEPYTYPSIVDDSKIWVHFEDLQIQGWDFGIPCLTPILLSNTPPDKPCLGFIKGTDTGPPKIQDTVTGKEVFWLCGRHAKPALTQWDGRYLIAGYGSGELLILDFKHIIPQ